MANGGFEQGWAAKPLPRAGSQLTFSTLVKGGSLYDSEYLNSSRVPGWATNATDYYSPKLMANGGANPNRLGYTAAQARLSFPNQFLGFFLSSLSSLP